MGAYKYVSCEGTVASVEDAFSELESLKDEMTEWRDNMEEKLSHTDKYQMVSDCADALDQACDNVDVPDVVREIAIQYSEARQRRKGRGESRAVRCANAVAVLEAAVGACEAWLEGLPADDENKDDVEQFVSDLNERIDAAQSAEFPGMFG